MKRGIMLIMMVALFCSLTDTLAWGKKPQQFGFPQEFSSGWRIVGMLPTSESQRVRDFENKVSGCDGCAEMLYKLGNCLLFREMRKVNYDNWWTVIVDIPDDQFIIVKSNAEFIMKAISKGDTVKIESQRMAIARGWSQGSAQNAVYFVGRNAFPINPSKNPSREPVYYLGEKTFQIKSSQNPTMNDFEWADMNIINGRKYVLMYIWFGENLKIKETLGFEVEGMDSYNLQTTARR